MEIGSLESALTGAEGCLFIDGASTADIKYFIVNADAVLTVLTGSEGTNELTGIGLSGKTIKAGMKITPSNKYFTAVTVSSGSIIGYK